MPTKKRRLNITLNKDTALYLKQISIRDDIPEATKAAEMVEMAMAFEEDAFFSKRAEAIDKKTKRWISHEKFWSNLL
ncbi:MAG: hypothetical protein WCG83_05850 [Candidatus Peregrinibacteria bacterium]